MPDNTTGSANLDNSHVNGVVVGVNLGTVIYGRPPEEIERQRLVGYLEQLANSHRKMRVTGLGGARLESGIDLASVYIMLAVQKRYREIRPIKDNEIIDHQHRQFKLPKEFKSERCLPDQEIVNIANDKSHGLVWVRSELATETVLQNQYLVLCGAPGSGKSTFAKHLVWVLAQRGLDQIDHQTSLVGWADKQQLLPIFMPLRALAGALANKDLGLNAEPKIGLLLEALCAYLDCQYGLDEPRQLLESGLHQPRKLLFVFDGLDEVPLEPNKLSLDRASLLKFLRIFADCKPNARLLITCRSRAWTQEYDNLTHWPMVELAPLTGGQIAHFINHWFPQLVVNGVISNTDAQRYSEQLVQALHDPKHQKLSTMAGNPLLLSMMIFVLIEEKVLPRDSYDLYERILEQLLGQWDAKRDGQSLGQAIGDERITSQELRNQVLDQICYNAHLQASSEDGRGRIQGYDLRDKLSDYFDRVNVVDPYRAAERCIAYIDQRSGLLQPEDAGRVYAFAHLTLQEHSAGRYLLFHESIEQILALRHDDRWHEPIFLGVGCLKKSIKTDKLGLLLNALTNPYYYRQDKPKPINEWYRDLILAAELMEDHDRDLLSESDIDVLFIKRELRHGLAQLLNDREHAQAALDYFHGRKIDPAPLLVTTRQHAAELLASLGDPRYPVNIEQWHQETRQLSQQFGRDGKHYWRYVPAGCYKVGSWDAQANYNYTTVKLQSHWVGRFMITVDQYNTFIYANGYHDDSWWSDNGRRWKNENRRTEPHWWNHQLHHEYLNQPVYGVSWYEAMAYCNWLNQQLKLLLPQGHRICLASEAEWEVAAAYDGQGQRQTYPWGEQPATPEHAVYGWSKTGRPLSVGLGIMGQAACGAADSTDNLLEWTATSYRGDGGPNEVLSDSKDWIVLGGNAYYDTNSINILFAANDSFYPNDTYLYPGFRCVIAYRENTDHRI